jgi:hypothetical protein
MRRQQRPAVPAPRPPARCGRTSSATRPSSSSPSCPSPPARSTPQATAAAIYRRTVFRSTARAAPPSGAEPASLSSMPSLIKSVSYDAAEALALARFWAAVLGSDVDEDSSADTAFVEGRRLAGVTGAAVLVPA